MYYFQRYEKPAFQNLILAPANKVDKTRTIPCSNDVGNCALIVKSRVCKKLNIANVKFTLILGYHLFVNQKVFMLWLEQEKNKLKIK